MTFSGCTVLMCLYAGDDPIFFGESMQSIFSQTKQPKEIIIVIDGKISDELEKKVDEFKENKAIKIIRLRKNMGVGYARNKGLAVCSNDLVAIMDADDIMVKKRLELQLKEFKKDPDLTILGGQLAEFKNNDVKDLIFLRHVPLTQSEIISFARKRSPFNNQTVMYKKSAAIAAGGYPNVNRAEDYRLYAKMLIDGAKAKNLDQVLTYFRLDNSALERRKTWKHTKETIEARNEIRKLGLCNIWDFLYTSMAQILIFIMPLWFTKFVYSRIRK